MSAFCHESVIRKGYDEPCDRPAVTYRDDPWEGGTYPVCRMHAGPSAVSALLTIKPDLADSDLLGVVLVRGAVECA